MIIIISISFYLLNKVNKHAHDINEMKKISFLKNNLNSLISIQIEFNIRIYN
jgi:hypothetical protein